MLTSKRESTMTEPRPLSRELKELAQEAEMKIYGRHMDHLSTEQQYNTAVTKVTEREYQNTASAADLYYDDEGNVKGIADSVSAGGNRQFFPITGETPGKRNRNYAILRGLVNDPNARASVYGRMVQVTRTDADTGESFTSNIMLIDMVDKEVNATPKSTPDSPDAEPSSQPSTTRPSRRSRSSAPAAASEEAPAAA